MKKKVLLGIILVATISFLGCSSFIVEKSIEKAKISIEARDYDKAIVSLEMALEEEPENNEANTLYGIVSSYQKAKKNIEEGKFKEANRILILLDGQDIEYPIKDDIEKLKEEMDKHFRKEVGNKDFTGTKEKYIEKLYDLEKEIEDANYYSNDAYTTPEMVEAEGKVLTKWDDLLNEIYNLLKVQLSKEEMDVLTSKQVNWIKYRDMTAENEASNFEGGSFARVQRVSTLGRLTKERCYELVNIYMK